MQLLFTRTPGPMQVFGTDKGESKTWKQQVEPARQHRLHGLQEGRSINHEQVTTP